MDNPAARLLAILEEAKKISGSTNCRDAWYQLLNIENKEQAVLMGRMGKVMSLSTEIIEKLQSIDGIKVNRYLHWTKPLEKAFMDNNLNGHWNSFTQSLDGHVINYLSMTSDLLSIRMPEPVLSKSSLDSILTNARSLIDEVRESELPPKIKDFMLKQLHRICFAVEEYSINGAESISKAVESAFGYGVLNGDSVELAKTDETAKKFWQKMANIALVISMAAGVQQLSAPIVKLLPDIEFTQKTGSSTEETREFSEAITEVESASA